MGTYISIKPNKVIPLITKEEEVPVYIPDSYDYDGYETVIRQYLDLNVIPGCEGHWFNCGTNFDWCIKCRTYLREVCDFLDANSIEYSVSY